MLSAHFYQMMTAQRLLWLIKTCHVVKKSPRVSPLSILQHLLEKLMKPSALNTLFCWWCRPDNVRYYGSTHSFEAYLFRKKSSRLVATMLLVIHSQKLICYHFMTRFQWLHIRSYQMFVFVWWYIITHKIFGACMMIFYRSNQTTTRLNRVWILVF